MSKAEWGKGEKEMTLTELIEATDLTDTEIRVFDNGTEVEIDFNKEYDYYRVVSIKARNYLLIVEVK